MSLYGDRQIHVTVGVCAREPRGVREGEGAVEEEEGMPHGLPVLPVPSPFPSQCIDNA